MPPKRGDPFSLAALSTSFGRTGVAKGGATPAERAARKEKSAGEAGPPPPTTSPPKAEASFPDTVMSDAAFLASLPIASFATLKDHERAVSTLTLDASGSRLISGSHDYACRFWDFNSMDAGFRPAKGFVIEEGHQVKQLDYSLSGDCFLAAANSPQCHLYDRTGTSIGRTAKGDPYIRDLRSTKGHVAGMTACQWHPKDRTLFMTAAMDGMVRLWDAQDLLQSKQAIMLRPGQARQGGATAAKFGKEDGRWLLTASKDATIKVWDWAKKSIRPDVAIANAHAADATIGSLLLLPDDRTLFSRATDNTLKVWDVRQPKQAVKVFDQMPSLYDETGMALSPEGDCLVTGISAQKGAAAGALAFIDPKTLTEQHRHVIEVTLGSPVALTWHSKLNQLFVGMSSGAIHGFYDVDKSHKGVLLGVSKEIKKPRIEDIRREGEIQIYIPGVTNREQQLKKKQAVSMKPEGVATGGRGAGGQIGTNTVQHLMKQFVGVVDDMRSQDPREALLKYEDNTKARYVTGYDETQPKRVFDTSYLDEEEVDTSISGRQAAQRKKLKQTDEEKK